MKTISFREIAKMIHPDLNPNITNAGEKMTDAVKFKNDPSILYRKAVEWGLIKDDTIIFTTSNTTSNTTWSASENGVVVVDVKDVVRIYKSPSMFITGCIVKITTVTKGKRKGWLKFFIVSDNKKMYTTIRTDKYTSSSFKKMFTTDTFDYYIDVYNDYLAAVERRKEARIQRKKEKAETIMNELHPNTNYQGQNKKVFITTRGRIFTVTKTTKKRVYYYDSMADKERFCNFSSVGFIY